MKKILLLTVIFCVFCIFGKAYSLGLDSIDILTGFLEADLKDKDDYQGIPLFVSLNFDAKPLFSKVGIETQGRLNFTVEPFANTIISPDNNVEVGSNFLLKYVFPLSETFQPFFKGGLGVLYMSQKTNEQSTQYNFLPQAGVGFHLFYKDNAALTFEYRYRHLSNNSFGNRNGGIDASMILAGVSFFFE